ncbi:MAG: sporulation protein YqfD [Clostridia bacterium]|nr:sporulation protein YqfD [Clostridia bacterium]
MMKGIKRLFQRRFRAEGLSLEKLVALCAAQEISLSCLRRTGPKCLKGRVSESDYPRLCALAQERGWQITSLGSAGISRGLERMKERWGLAVGLGLTTLLIIAAMQFVWRVEIVDAGAYEGDVRGYLTQHAIGVGTYKGRLDLAQLQTDLEWRYPKVAWVQTALRGSTLVVRLVEGIPVPQVAPYGQAGDMVAARGGVIVTVEPAAGTALVKAGDIVIPGQVLIQGVERRGEAESVQVKARGRILARVWDQARVQMPLNETLSEPTGESCVVQALVTPWFQWGDLEHPEYEASDTLVEIWPLGGAWWPVSLRRETTEAVKLRLHKRDQAQVEAEAGLAAMRLLRQKIGLDDDLVDKWVDCCMIEGGIVEACATAERVINIAVQAPASGPQGQDPLIGGY